MSARKVSAAAIRKYNPLPGDVKVDMPLSSFAVGYADNDTTYMVSKLGNAGVIKSDRRTGVYFKFSKADAFRNGATKVGNSGPLPVVEQNIEQVSYECDIWGVAARTPRIVAADAMAPLNLEQSDAELVADNMLRGMELNFVSTVLTATPDSSAWGQSWTATSGPDNFGSSVTKQWDLAGSRPCTVIDLVKKGITTANGGKRPNYAIFGSDVVPHLRNNSDVLARYPGASEVIVDEQMLAKLFGIPNVLISEAAYNTAAEGAAATMADVFAKSVWIGYVAPTPGIKQRTAFARIDWTGMPDSVEGMQVMRRYDPDTREDVTEAQRSWVYKIVDLSSGGFLASVVS